MRRNRLFVSFVCCCAPLLLFADVCLGQKPLFGIDFQGPTFGMLDPAGVPIFAAEVLSPALGVPMPGPLPPPMVVVPGGPMGIGLGIRTWPQLGEVDAISYGNDMRVGWWHFSVDEFAAGLPGPKPDVASEGMAGNREASADVFSGNRVFMHPLVPLPLPGVIGTNLDLLDGNGLPPMGLLGKGLGLIEPNPPTMGPPDLGDNLDALEIDPIQLPIVPRVFFSLDARFLDPLEPPRANSGSAAANGFVGGDVLVSVPGGPPALYVPAVVLGLDRIQGPDSDDLDALMLQDNGDGIYNPMQDFIAFSVRRASVVIGAPDSVYGAPIAEADILIPPVAGGVSPFPGILVPGEALGLRTPRVGMPPSEFWDDLDALDLYRYPGDCNGDGRVNVFDLQIMGATWNKSAGMPGYDPRADFTGDNRVNVFDLQVMGANWNTQMF